MTVVVGQACLGACCHCCARCTTVGQMERRRRNERIRLFRRKGLTLRQIAERWGLSRGQIVKILREA